MLRKMVVGLLVIVLVFSCCGCGETTAQQVIPEDLFAEELATDELVVYGWKAPELLLGFDIAEITSNTIRLMKNKHEVTVTYREFTYEEYDDILTIDLMAGKGPDVVLWENMREDMFSDPAKIIEANVFMDLNPLFAQDTEFSFSDYSSAIDAGLLNGGRYYVPLCYFVGTTVTLEEQIDSSGFPWTRYPTYDEYTESFLAYIREQSSNALKKATPNYSWQLDTYLYTSGLQLIDFETQTVLPDREGLRKLADFCKALNPYLTDHDVIKNAYETYYQSNWPSIDLYNPHCVFVTHFSPLYTYCANGTVSTDLETINSPWLTGALPTVQDSKPVAIPGISATIRNGTPNLQNAYYYLKFLLSEAVQSGYWVTLPVNRPRAEHHIDWYSHLHDPGEEPYKEALIEILTDVEPYKQFSTKQWELFVRYMTPYWEGNASYEDCVAELEAMLELYMYE